MVDWLRANCPNIEALIEELDTSEKQTLPLGPYREQASDLKRDAFTRFAAKVKATEFQVPSLSDILHDLDQQETAIVALGSYESSREQMLEDHAVLKDFLDLGVSQSEHPKAHESLSSGDTTLAKTVSAVEKERKKTLGEMPIAKVLQAKGLDLYAMLEQNQAEESEIIGFEDYRLRDHLTHVEKRMQEVLANRAAWKAIKDREIDMQLQRAPKIRAKRLGRGDSSKTNMPKSGVRRGNHPAALSVQHPETRALKKRTHTKRALKATPHDAVGYTNDDEREEEDEVNDQQCAECGIVGSMTRCRHCSAFLCSMTCREEHEAATCGGLFGGSSASTSDCSEGEDAIVETRSGTSSMDVSIRTEASRIEAFSVSSKGSRSVSHAAAEVASSICSCDVELVVPSADDLLAQLDVEDFLDIGEQRRTRTDCIRDKAHNGVPSRCDDIDTYFPSAEELLAQLDAEEFAEQRCTGDRGVQKWKESRENIDVD